MPENVRAPNKSVSSDWSVTYKYLSTLLSLNDATTGYWSTPVLLIKVLQRGVTKSSQSSIILISDKESLSVKPLKFQNLFQRNLIEKVLEES